MVLDAAPEILSHNLETVRRLTKEVRIQAKYRSLEVLMRSKRAGLRTKSGIYAGLGRNRSGSGRKHGRSAQCWGPYRKHGQHLQPTKEHLPVAEYIHPDRFRRFKEVGMSEGFRYVESGPLVRKKPPR